MSKKFLCVWGQGYMAKNDGEAIVETKDVDFFITELGYTRADISVIQAMGVGVAYNVPDFCNWHSVVRIA